MSKFKICVNEEECIGDGLCAQEAPGTFEMNDDDKAVLMNPVTDNDETILEAAAACPEDAIIVSDEAGKQLYPEE